MDQHLGASVPGVLAKGVDGSGYCGVNDSECVGLHSWLTMLAYSLNR